MITAIHTAVKGRVRYKVTELYGSVPLKRREVTDGERAYRTYLHLLKAHVCAYYATKEQCRLREDEVGCYDKSLHTGSEIG